MEMFWLFSISVWRMVTVSFGMMAPAFICSLLILYSGRVKCGDSDVFGVWVRKVISVSYFGGSVEWASGLLSMLGLVRFPSV